MSDLPRRRIDVDVWARETTGVAGRFHKAHVQRAIPFPPVDAWDAPDFDGVIEMATPRMNPTGIHVEYRIRVRAGTHSAGRTVEGRWKAEDALSEAFREVEEKSRPLP